MELIRELSDLTFGIKPRDVKFVVRRASRAVVLNEKGEVALMHGTKKGYYKLPGGGIEHREKIEAALYREVLEETGYTVKIRRTVGAILEYRSKVRVITMSYCFLVGTIGQQTTPKYTEKETNEGFELAWFSKEEALKVMRKQRSAMTNYMGKFMTERDLTFLERGLGVQRVPGTGSRKPAEAVQHPNASTNALGAKQ